MLPSLSRVVEHAGTTVGSAAILAFGLLQGAQFKVVTLGLAIVTIRIGFLEALSGVVVFTLLMALTGLALAREVWRSRADDPAVESGPPVDAIVPVYRDHAVLDVSVESLVASDYEDLTVTIVAEPSDDPTIERARELAAEHEPVRVLRNGQPGSKAGAINHAVAVSEADHFAVFDADEWIAPGFVPRAVAALEEGADVFQARRVPRPTGAVETIAYCERLLFHAGYKIVELFGFNNCRSSSTAFTREAFDRVGGYEDVLTEDLEFAHACYRAGLAVRQDRQWTNTMEAPHSLTDLWCQRRRWRVGQIQVLHRTLGDVLRRDVGWRGLLSIGRMASSLLGSLGVLALAGKVFLLVLVDAESGFLVPLALLLAVIAAVGLRDARDGRIDGLHPSAALVFLVYPAFGVLTLQSVLEYVLSWDGEWYRVTKTGA